jgi:hypothetical protein
MTSTHEATPTDPHADYTSRLRERQALRDALGRSERLLGNGKVVLFLAGGLAAYLAFGPHLFSPWLLLVPLALFSVLLVWHERVTRDWLRARRAVAVYERGLARLEDRWQGTGQTDLRFLDPGHPNAADLNLFGPDSLFELLCTARTRTGEDTLARWLKAPASPDEIRARQQAVDELRPRLDLREDLALLGANVSHGVDFDGMIAWGKEPALLTSSLLRVAIFFLGLISLAVTVEYVSWYVAANSEMLQRELLTRNLILLGTLGTAGGLALVLKPKVSRVVAAVEKRGRDLALLAGVLRRLEEEHFKGPRLQELRAELETGGASPSASIAKLCGLIDLLNARRNQFFIPVALLLMWTTQLAFALERWRQRWGPAIGHWLHVVGEIEALCSMATYAFEHPADPFPEVVAEGPYFEGEALGHPLIPAKRCVSNDLKLDRDRQVLIVSGSNMSGKSTVLRTAGINTVLALAGGPVRAARMKLSPLVVGTSLHVEDSLAAGQSRFYAELLRVKQLVDLSRRQPPLFFLLDEIFHGTNSHDRCQGAEAVVAGLVRAGAIGLVTTHDLTLTHIVETLAPHADNVHFADHMEDGRMVFDYRMQSGVVNHSNAIALMRAVGLEV